MLDPFAGSGSTLLACKYSKRNYIGCEIDKEYYDIILKRLDEKSLIKDNEITLF